MNQEDSVDDRTIGCSAISSYLDVLAMIFIIRRYPEDILKYKSAFSGHQMGSVQFFTIAYDEYIQQKMELATTKQGRALSSELFARSCRMVPYAHCWRPIKGFVPEENSMNIYKILPDKET